MTADHWLRLARAAAPELDLTAVELVETGWDSRVLRTRASDGRRWIFRFVRRTELLPDIERERSVLRLVAPALTVAVPDWQVYSSPSGADGQLVVRYPELAGVPAGDEPRGDGDFVFTISLPPPSTHLRSLGSSLAELHRVQPDGLAPVTAEDLRSELAGTLADAARLAVPPPLLDRWRAWLDGDEFWSFRTTLRHGDVHPGHTLIDQDGTLTGLIDWTDAAIGDPAHDFVDVRHAFGSTVADDLLRAYREAGGEPTVSSERIALLQSIGPVNAAVFGRRNGLPHVATRALERLRDHAARLGPWPPAGRLRSGDLLQ